MNRKGYKHTSLGWIPEEWEVKKLEEVSEIKQGVSKGRSIAPENAISVPYMRVANVKDGEIDLTEVKKIVINKDELSRYALADGDILITEGGDPDKLGRGGIWTNSIKDCVFQNHLFRIRTDGSKLDHFFLYHFFQGFRAKTYFLSCAKQTTGIASINSSQVKAAPIPLPSFLEQRQIAAILVTWDARIEKEQRLIAALEIRHRGLMQQLLSGKRRLKGFEAKWNFIRFKDIYKAVKQTVGDKSLIPLSVTKDGIVSQREYFSKEIVSEDASCYLHVKRGNMVMSGLNFWMGSIDIVKDYEEGMVSPAYKVYEINNPLISPDFMRYFVRSAIMLRALIASSVIGASIVRRNLEKEMLEEWSFQLPPLGEQEAIANVLDISMREIQLHRGRLAALQQQKKGLMQALLTGKVRVKLTDI